MNIAACHRLAAFTFERQALPHIERAGPKGELVASFVLPLHLCPTLNAFAEMSGWKRSDIKRRLRDVMLIQRVRDLKERRFPPVGQLLNRPQVRAIRFSSREPDRDSAFAKMAVDRLTGRHGGLGLIEDDHPTKLDLRCWWEPAPQGSGFVLLELRTGEVPHV